MSKMIQVVVEFTFDDHADASKECCAFAVEQLLEQLILDPNGLPFPVGHPIPLAFSVTAMKRPIPYGMTLAASRKTIERKKV
jgi:hypothetical protein